MLHVLKERLESSMYTYSLVSYIEALRCCPVIQQNRNPLLFHKRDAWAFAKSCNTESMIASRSNFQSVLSFNSRKELTPHLCPASVSLPGQVRFVVFTLSATPPVIFNYHTTENWIHLALAGFLAYPPFCLLENSHIVLKSFHPLRRTLPFAWSLWLIP